MRIEVVRPTVPSHIRRQRRDYAIACAVLGVALFAAVVCIVALVGL